MCGIWAMFGSDECVSVQCRSCVKISHRGPDSFRIENIPEYRNCAIGFHRLCILDNVYGMQPLRIHTLPKFWLCYNGEIYNYKVNQKEFNFNYETQVDGESILHLYNKGGIEFATQHLDGVFALCIVDVEKKQVHLARDTFGIKPLFRLTTDRGFLCVCSEAKGLMDVVHGDPSKVKIDVFSPGFYETYDLADDGTTTLVCSKRFHKIGNAPLYKTLVMPSIEEDIYSNIRTIFYAAVRKRLMGARRIGCLLSGGLDSSLIAAAVCKLAKEEGITYPVQTFTTGMAGSPDVIAAKSVADHIGSEHHEVLFSAEEGIAILEELIYFLETYDIVTVRASIAGYLVSKFISNNSDSIIIFSGEGADELAQGYIYFKKAPSAKAGNDESHRLLNDLYLYDVLRADRTTAAHGLEIRVPFLDHQFTAYYLSLPAELRQPSLEKGEKLLIRKAFDDSNLIPNDILWRPKEGFSDGVSSQTNSLHEILHKHANSVVSDADFAMAKETFPFNTPHTKEAYYYRQVFEHKFPGRSGWTPYYWLNRWTDSKDPSARTLNHYKTNKTSPTQDEVIVNNK